VPSSHPGAGRRTRRAIRLDTAIRLARGTRRRKARRVGSRGYNKRRGPRGPWAAAVMLASCGGQHTQAPATTSPAASSPSTNSSSTAAAVTGSVHFPAQLLGLKRRGPAAARVCRAGRVAVQGLRRGRAGPGGACSSRVAGRKNRDCDYAGVFRYGTVVPPLRQASTSVSRPLPAPRRRQLRERPLLQGAALVDRICRVPSLRRSSRFRVTGGNGQ